MGSLPARLRRATRVALAGGEIAQLQRGRVVRLLRQYGAAIRQYGGIVGELKFHERPRIHRRGVVWPKLERPVAVGKGTGQIPVVFRPHIAAIVINERQERVVNPRDLDGVVQVRQREVPLSQFFVDVRAVVIWPSGTVPGRRLDRARTRIEPLFDGRVRVVGAIVSKVTRAGPYLGESWRGGVSRSGSGKTQDDSCRCQYAEFLRPHDRPPAPNERRA